MKRKLGVSPQRAGAAGSGRQFWRAAWVAASLTAITLPAWANPQGGHVVAGSGSISAPNTNTTVVHQNSNNLVINWNSFNIGANQSVKFVQPTSQSAALNRIFS